MNFHFIPCMGLLSFLLGCGGSSSPYTQKKGAWYYKDDIMRVPAGEQLEPLNGKFAKSKTAAFYMSATVPEADVRTFEALSESYARDRAHVFYCDTYRNGQEYFSIKHIRTRIIPGADAGSFRVVDGQYARDKSTLFHEGVPFAVRDIETFQLLDYNFARDRMAAYYMRVEIPGSHGPTFSALNPHYGKDSVHVFHADLDTVGSTRPRGVVSVALPGADAATFVALESGYAMDAGQAYYGARVLEKAPVHFRVLQYGYALSNARVFYDGEIVKGADPASFETLPLTDGGPTARDRSSQYHYAEKVRK